MDSVKIDPTGAGAVKHRIISRLPQPFNPHLNIDISNGVSRLSEKIFKYFLVLHGTSNHILYIFNFPMKKSCRTIIYIAFQPSPPQRAVQLLIPLNKLICRMQFIKVYFFFEIHYKYTSCLFPWNQSKTARIKYFIFNFTRVIVFDTFLINNDFLLFLEMRLQPEK